MTKEQKTLADMVVYKNYARYIETEGRRENYEEVVNRVESFLQQEHPALSDEINKAFEHVYAREVLPSMRLMQFAGKPVSLMPNRLYNCLAEETEFLTAQGIRSFKDYHDGDRITVCSGEGKIRKAIVRNYGEDSLNKITFNKGTNKQVVYATSGHRWYLQDGTVTMNLKEGDKIKIPEHTFKFDYEKATIPQKLMWAYGFVYGDGTVIDKTHSLVRLCGGKSRFKDRFQELGFSTSSSLAVDGDFFAYTGKYKKTLPDIATTGTADLQAFIQGYLDADGNRNPDWYTNNSLSEFKGIQATGEESINFLREALPMVGLYILSEDDLTGQETNYGVRPYTIRFRVRTSGQSQHYSVPYRVKEINYDVRQEEVWCLEVETDHNFQLGNGIVTGNCAFMAMDDTHAFSEMMFLLLGGSGVGYSVQQEHIVKLPQIVRPAKQKRYVVGDSITGWADSIKVLCEAFFKGKYLPRFDFEDIRPKGTPLKTSGGKSPGSAPLEKALKAIEIIMRQAEGRQLISVEVFDIACYIADAVMAGGIRRAACIALFSKDDEDMFNAKTGNWLTDAPQRCRANISVALNRNTSSDEDIARVVNRCRQGGYGEPGLVFTHHIDYGYNPCGEIYLEDCSFCNL